MIALFSFLFIETHVCTVLIEKKENQFEQKENVLSL